MDVNVQKQCVKVFTTEGVINMQPLLVLTQDLTGVAQESTLTQGISDIRDDISHIDIDTTTLAKEQTLTDGIGAIRDDISHISIDTSTLAQRTDVKDGNDTAISVSKEIRSEVGTGSDTAAESGTLFAVLKWVKDKVKSIYNAITDGTNGLAAIKQSIDNIDTTTLAKQGSDANANISDIESAIGTPGTGQPSTLFAAIAAGGGGGGDAQESTSQAILAAVNDILPNQQAVLQSYATLDEKGVTIPSAQDQTIENLPATIGQINKEFVGYAYLSAIAVRNSPDNPKLNFSGVVFTGTSLNLANMVHINEIIAPRTTDALTSFTFNPNSTYNYVDVRLMTTKNVTSLNSWGNCKKINASGCDFTGATSAYSMFQNQSRVEWLDFSGTKVSSNLTNAGNCFLSGCQYCTTLVGDHTLQDVIDNNICFFEGLCINLPFFYVMTLLDRNSLRAVINGLADLSGQTTQTFQFGATLLAKLTAEDIAIATAKNWNLT